MPGYFAPVEVDGRHYLDGGIKSSTNADVLRTEGLDLVITIAPMCPVDVPQGRSIDSYLRGKASRLLRSELAALERHDATTVVFGPGPEVLPHMASDFMSVDATPDIVLSAFMETGTQLRDTPLVDVFARSRAA